MKCPVCQKGNMEKKKDINELTNLMSKALRHKIGSIVNKDEFYAN